MKTILRSAIVMASLTALGISVTSAQAQGQSRPNIAVIDISRIFKQHQNFRAQLNDMKKDVETAEASLRKERDEIQTLMQKLKTINIGSPDYQRLDDQITTRSANLQLTMKRQQKEFMRQEAKIYFNVYRQIETEVQKFAAPRGIDLVLRYNDIELDNPEDRQAILANVNKAVVYHNNIDITDIILKQLNPPQAFRPEQRGQFPR